ncbi:MAG TPA: hypothetical protein VF187_08630, partial [Gemmatimonadales bacterium]
RQLVRRRRLARSLARLERAAIPDEVDLTMMEQIVRAWDNPGYAGDAAFLLQVARDAWEGPGPVLDCGSGLSTIVCAAVAARRGARVWSLEQDASWHEDVRGMVSALRLDNVVLWHAPLRSYGGYVWYDLTGRELPRHFSVVACDGPAVRRSEWPPARFAAWRVGGVLALKELGIRFDRIILDDADDSRAPGLVERWEREGIAMREIASATGRHLVGHPPAE